MNKNVITLVFLVLVFTCTNTLRLPYDTVPSHWDTANHMLSALKYHEVISSYFHQGNWLSIQSIKTVLRKLLEVDQFVYPPLFPFVGSFMIFLPGISIKWFAMTNVLFMVVLVYSLFQIAKWIHSEEVGILSCAIFVLYPTVFNVSREFMLEIALLAVTALSCYFLLCSEEFGDHTFAFLFDISVGLGVLVKPTYLSYVFGPVCYVPWSKGSSNLTGTFTGGRECEIKVRSLRKLPRRGDTSNRTCIDGRAYYSHSSPALSTGDAKQVTQSGRHSWYGRHGQVRSLAITRRYA